MKIYKNLIFYPLSYKNAVDLFISISYYRIHDSGSSMQVKWSNNYNLFITIYNLFIINYFILYYFLDFILSLKNITMKKEKRIIFDYNLHCKLYNIWLSINQVWSLYYIFDLKSEKIKKILNRSNLIEDLNRFLKKYKEKAIENRDFYILSE